MRPTPKVAFPPELVDLIAIEQKRRRARWRKVRARLIAAALYALGAAVFVLAAAHLWGRP